MTFTQTARIAGFKANLAARGRAIVCDTKDGAGVEEKMMALIEDSPALQDPDKPAQQATPVYTRVSCLAGAIKDPRKVKRFTEDDGRWHKVLTYDETRGDAVTWKWTCEAQRQ